MANIYFDTDNNLNTGQRKGADGPLGYEFELITTLMARSGHGFADWANAHMNLLNLLKVNGHVLRCNLYRVAPTPGPGLVEVNPRGHLSRGKVDAKVIWITLTYSELGVSPGKTVRITFMDQGNAVYTDGDMLPSFPILLQ